MAPWVRKTFVDVLPRYLFIQRPEKGDEPGENFHNLLNKLICQHSRQKIFVEFLLFFWEKKDNFMTQI
jgi:hypothetical protein